MKKFIILMVILAFIGFSAFMCESNNPAEIVLEADCFDSSKVNKDALCIAIYDPVCGCDKKTYGNSCEAINSGILEFTNGKCD
jgi:hypothetical protein